MFSLISRFSQFHFWHFVHCLYWKECNNENSENDEWNIRNNEKVNTIRTAHPERSDGGWWQGERCTTLAAAARRPAASGPLRNFESCYWNCWFVFIFCCIWNLGWFDSMENTRTLCVCRWFAHKYWSFQKWSKIEKCKHFSSGLILNHAIVFVTSKSSTQSGLSG